MGGGVQGGCRANLSTAHAPALQAGAAGAYQRAWRGGHLLYSGSKRRFRGELHGVFLCIWHGVRRVHVADRHCDGDHGVWPDAGDDEAYSGNGAGDRA